MSSSRTAQASSSSKQKSGQSQHSKNPKSDGKNKHEVIVGPKKKKRQNAKIWHKLKENKKRTPTLLRMPNEVLEAIFKHAFIGVHMTDIKTTQRGTDQRRRGAQSMLVVCKELREVATEAMFKYAVFDIPHFKLHEKHRRENPMETLHKIQHLDLLWTPPPSASFTTKRGDDAYILNGIDHLRSLQVWLLASQHLRLSDIEYPEFMSRVEVEEALLRKFEPSVSSQPRWLKRLLRDAPKKFEGIEISLVGFFAFGPRSRADLAFGPRHSAALTAAHISWPSRTIDRLEDIKWTDWQRARAGFTCKNLHRFYAYASSPYDSSSNAALYIFGTAAGRLNLVREVMHPGVGERTFGRKAW